MARFLFLTTGFNPIRTLAARLQYFEAASGERWADALPAPCPEAARQVDDAVVPAPVYYVDLCARDGIVLDAAVSQAQAEAQERARRSSMRHGRRSPTGRSSMARRTSRRSSRSSMRRAGRRQATGQRAHRRHQRRRSGRRSRGGTLAERLAEKDEASVTARPNATVTDGYASTKVSSQTRRQRLGILTSLLQRPPLATV